MIPNLINTLGGLVLMYAVVLHATWVEQRYFPWPRLPPSFS